MRSSLDIDTSFYKRLLILSLPIVVQNLITCCMGLLDTLMIGQLGEAEIAAVGIANQYFFLFALVTVGVSGGASIFMAQLWGKRDIPNIHRVIGIALVCGTGVAGFFAGAILLFPDKIMGTFSHDIHVIALSVKYIKIIAFTFILHTLNLTYSFALRSIGQTKAPMKISLVAIATNGLLNYALIFGKWGFPNMGVEGAAMATLIARIVELSLTLCVVYTKNSILRCTFREMFNFSKEFILSFFKISTPVIMNEALWAGAVTACSIAYAYLGTESLAAIQIAKTVQDIFIMIMVGFCSGAAIMIGVAIGEGREDLATTYAKNLISMGMIGGVISGLTLFVSAPWILSIFNISSFTYDIALKVLKIMAVIIAAKFFNLVLVLGILRPGGDTRYTLITETCSMWLIAVPMAFLGAKILNLPMHWVLALVGLEEISKALLILPRLISQKWIHNVVESM